MSSYPPEDGSSGIGSGRELEDVPLPMPELTTPAPPGEASRYRYGRSGDGLNDMEFVRLRALAESLLGYYNTRHVEMGGTSALIGAVRDKLESTYAPVTIYLSEETSHAEVQSAVEDLLESAGLVVEVREDPVIGSWFRRIWVAFGRTMRSEAVREGALMAAHVADTRLVLAQDAAITATLLQNLGPVLASLDSTKDAVLRIGALLIVKLEWTVNVFQLTAAQQATLDHRPQLAMSPQEIVRVLGLEEGTGPGA